MNNQNSTKINCKKNLLKEIRLKKSFKFFKRPARWHGEMQHKSQSGVNQEEYDRKAEPHTFIKNQWVFIKKF
jgi:hypothetical protein